MQPIRIVAYVISALVVITWLATSSTYAFDAIKFLGDTGWNLESPKGSLSEHAQKTFENYFAEKGEENRFPVQILVECLDRSVCGGENTSGLLNDANVRFLGSQLQTLVKCVQNKCFWRGVFTYTITYESNPNYDSVSLSYLKLQYISSDGLIMRFEMPYNAGFGLSQMYTKFDELTEMTKTWKSNSTIGNSYQVSIINENIMLRDAKDDTIHDFEYGDSISLAFAWSILFYATGPSASVIFLTLPCSLLISFSILELLIHDYTFAQFDPSIFLSLLLAMTNDFALFMLTRYKDELKKTDDNLVAIKIMMQTAGSVIFLSGAILGASFGGLSMINFNALKGMGVGGAITITTSVICHLTMLPALLVLVGHFRYTRKLMLNGIYATCCKKQVKDKLSDVVADKLSQDSINDKAENGEAVYKKLLDEEKGEKLKVSIWVHIGEFCYVRKYWIVGSTFILLIPAIFVALRLRATTDQSLLIPSISPTIVAMDAMKAASFPLGLLAKYQIAVVAQPCANKDTCNSNFIPCGDLDADFAIVIKGLNISRGAPLNIDSCKQAVTKYKIFDLCHRDTYDKNTPGDLKKLMSTFCPGTCNNYCLNRTTTVVNEEMFSLIKSFKKQVIELNKNIRGGLTAGSFNDITSLLNGSEVSVDDALDFLLPGRNPERYNDSMAYLYRTTFDRTVNIQRTALSLESSPMGGSFDGSGEDVTRSVREVAAKPEFATTKYGFEIVSDVSQLLDGMAQVYEETPLMMVTTICGTVFVISLLAFRSLLLSIRLLCTIAVTIFGVFAVTILLFQDILGQSGIYWIIPIACAPVVCGLALDYDTLLISRIFEYRREGYTTKASVINGLHKTGGVITTAGIIMMVAFSSLMFSSEMLLKQFGFVLVMASFLDTFFVRTIFVPAVFFVGVESNWWPGKMPAGTKDDLDD